MDRRTFMKLLGGLASMPVIGRIAKPLKSETVQEGIASISLFGQQLQAVFISENISFLDPLQIHKLIKTQFLSLPVILIRSFTDILDCIKGHYTNRCLASLTDFQAIQPLLKPSISN